MTKAQSELTWLNGCEGLVPPWAGAFLVEGMNRRKIEKSFLGGLGGRACLLPVPSPWQGRHAEPLAIAPRARPARGACWTHSEPLLGRPQGRQGPECPSP